MSGDAVLALAVIGAALVALVREFLSPDIVLMTALGGLVVAGVLDIESALAGFANPTLLTIGALFVLAAGLRETGALETAATHLLGATSRTWAALTRLVSTSALSSAFLSNTALVAMGIPLIRAWAGQYHVAPSKLLIPLSFASMMGGLCTLIGTSTNLVTDGLLKSHGLAGLGFFELAAVGGPIAIVGIFYLVLIAPRLLPARREARSASERALEETLEVAIDPASPLAGLSLEEAGLQDIPGRALVRIERPEGVLSVDPSKETLQEGDRLTFTGKARALRYVEQHPGMRRIIRRTPVESVGVERHEVVVKEASALVRETLSKADFAGRYNAVVTGVRRGGHPLRGELREVILRAGDTLLLSTGRGFRDAFEGSAEFFIVTQAERDEKKSGPERRLPAVLVLVGVIVLMAFEIIPVALAALFGAVVVVAIGCISPGDARRAVDWSVLIVIGSALGLATALETSGAAEAIGRWVVAAGSNFGGIGILTAIFVAGMIFTAVITNNAAAALMFPIALSAAESQALDPRPFVIAITVAASLAFATPLGYQTNLMVYGPGGYRFSDFVRVGLPLQIIVAIVGIVVIQWVWPLVA